MDWTFSVSSYNIYEIFRHTLIIHWPCVTWNTNKCSKCYIPCLISAITSLQCKVYSLHQTAVVALCVLYLLCKHCIVSAMRSGRQGEHMFSRKIKQKSKGDIILQGGIGNLFFNSYNSKIYFCSSISLLCTDVTHCVTNAFCILLYFHLSMKIHHVIINRI